MPHLVSSTQAVCVWVEILAHDFFNVAQKNARIGKTSVVAMSPLTLSLLVALIVAVILLLIGGSYMHRSISCAGGMSPLQLLENDARYIQEYCRKQCDRTCGHFSQPRSTGTKHEQTCVSNQTHAAVSDGWCQKQVRFGAPCPTLYCATESAYAPPSSSEPPSRDAPTSIPDSPAAPTPARTIVSAPAPKFYGYWYSKYCAVGQPEQCSASTVSQCTTDSDTKAGATMRGLMRVEDMVKYAQTKGLMSDYKGLNTTVSLGIGSNLSYTTKSTKGGVVPVKNNNYTWKQLLCPPSDTVERNTSKYNLMNIGGWGNIDGGTQPMRWHLSDIPGFSSGVFDQLEIDSICRFMQEHRYDGISLDIEGVYDDWTQDGCNRHLSEACGAIKAQGFFVWIVLPGFNVRDEYGGPVEITNPNNITLVQLMCYGKGLDSAWGGDPSGIPLSKSKLSDTIASLNRSGVQADQIMLAWSFLDQQQNTFIDMIRTFGERATAGCFAWCKGNTATWTWSGKAVIGGNLASCAYTPK